MLFDPGLVPSPIRLSTDESPRMLMPTLFGSDLLGMIRPTPIRFPMSVLSWLPAMRIALPLSRLPLPTLLPIKLPTRFWPITLKLADATLIPCPPLAMFTDSVGSTPM
jgi:hypothetical protein